MKDAQKIAKYWDTLNAIARAESLSRLRRGSKGTPKDCDYGLNYYEALEMAYENLIKLAKAAIKGHRMPFTIG